MKPERALPVHKSKRGRLRMPGENGQISPQCRQSRRTSSDAGKPLIFTPIRESSAES
jgi:hypothetical protein